MMLTHGKRRGRPKGSHEPVSTTSRVEKFRNKLRAEGGAISTVNLDAQELAILTDIKSCWNLPPKTSSSEVIKAMICILGGGEYITPGKTIKAAVIIEERHEI